MAYNSVSQCRFYINALEWLDSNGAINIDNIFRTLPVSPISYSSITNTIPNILSTKSFIALLGHTFGDDANPATSFAFSHSGGYWSSSGDVVNRTHPYYNGFSIALFNGTDMYDSIGLESSWPINIGSIVIGNYYDMPHSPDMSLSLEYETGTKNIETRGGASLSNTMWRPPMWGSLAPWELSDPASPTSNQTLAHSSRRTWNLSFSFLSKENTFPEYNALNKLADNDETADTDQTLLTSDDFFSQVWNRVGTALPFIFQPDKDVLEFAICKFTKNLSVKQVSNQIYTIGLKISEVW